MVRLIKVRCKTEHIYSGRVTEEIAIATQTGGLEFGYEFKVREKYSFYAVENRQEQRYKNGSNIVSVMPGKFGAVDRNGKVILSPEFVQLGNFSNGLAWVNLGKDYVVHGNTDKWGYINKEGEFVWTRSSTTAAEHALEADAVKC